MPRTRIRTLRRRSPPPPSTGGQPGHAPVALTLYPTCLTLPPVGTWVLAAQGPHLRPAQWTPDGWTCRHGHPLTVQWWTPAPDEATRTGRDVLYVTGGL